MGAGFFPPPGEERSDSVTKTVLLHRGRKNEENFQIVSVNGRSWKIMKGVEVQVPDFVAEVLENAQMMADDARRYVDRMAN